MAAVQVAADFAFGAVGVVAAGFAGAGRGLPAADRTRPGH